MRLERTASLGSLLLSGSLLALGACGDDDGGGGAGTAESSTGESADTTATPPMTTEESVDTSAGPDPETTDNPTTSVDSTGEESSSGEPPPGGIDAFRFITMEIRDPHFFDTLLCTDITGMVNAQFADALAQDSPDSPDGLLDLSLNLVFRPASQDDGAVGDMDFANADCTAPVETTTCSLREGTALYPSSFVNTAVGTCHEADPTHLGGYNPPPGTTTGPCFASSATDVEIVTSFNLPLDQAIISAQYEGPDGLVSGTIRGFLTTANAESITLPEDLPIVGGSPISALLKGGMGTSGLCSGDDTDGDGWWFYVDFTAERVPWTE